MGSGGIWNNLPARIVEKCSLPDLSERNTSLGDKRHRALVSIQHGIFHHSIRNLYSFRRRYELYKHVIYMPHLNECLPRPLGGVFDYASCHAR